MTDLDRALGARAGGRCELCGATEALRVYVVPPRSAAPDTSVLVCGTCAAQLAGDAALDPTHWFCLKESIWSEVPVVQVVGLRLLARLGDASWAAELRAQIWVPDEVQAWADDVPAEAEPDVDAPTLDSHGAPLATGDSVTLIKDLDVKGAGFVAKRGTLVKNIRLTDDPAHVEGKVNGVAIVLKTQFLKKA
ncbi:PhnA domain-containing protein [Sandaracinus amylolyticus]|uniref:PhnA domain-containing protein n=1 Tax=Sandaracinus amylolyticus TaxID=927083 RepID=UPI001F32960E|nr:alkylphosphonate utilization protein [Sandaracinus amylolyticus]UJR82680.1 Hypothetical protein I5071_47450 [Sandaracinus amylolyticus]